mmetsp:Transcript_36620/g.91730  ORF Transcript_36620/g.91730 Transcript_36620/m.91730 type:complete len:183 (-) Transcript_36620:1676-2224(-)
MSAMAQMAGLYPPESGEQFSAGQAAMRRDTYNEGPGEPDRRDMSDKFGWGGVREFETRDYLHRYAAKNNIDLRPFTYLNKRPLPGDWQIVPVFTADKHNDPLILGQEPAACGHYEELWKAKHGEDQEYPSPSRQFYLDMLAGKIKRAKKRPEALRDLTWHDVQDKYDKECQSILAKNPPWLP